MQSSQGQPASTPAAVVDLSSAALPETQRARSFLLLSFYYRCKILARIPTQKVTREIENNADAFLSLRLRHFSTRK
jgi:hypothetical protein